MFEVGAAAVVECSGSASESGSDVHKRVEMLITASLNPLVDVADIEWPALSLIRYVTQS